jgi:hypothetical protein
MSGLLDFSPGWQERQASFERDQERALSEARAIAAARLQREAELELKLEAMRTGLGQVLRDDLRSEIAETMNAPPAAEARHRSEFSRFRRFAEENGMPWLPSYPEVIASYLVERAQDGLRPALRALTSIEREHAKVGHTSPTTDVLVRAALKWVRKHHKNAK